MQALYAQLLVGLINGSFYALLSLGLAVIFGMLNIINFAHGALYMMGAFCAYFLLNIAGIGYWPALILAPIAVGIFGMILERTMLQWLSGLDHLYGLLLTFGLALIIQGVFQNYFGSSGLPYAIPDELEGGMNPRFLFPPHFPADLSRLGGRIFARGMPAHLVPDRADAAWRQPARRYRKPDAGARIRHQCTAHDHADIRARRRSCRAGRGIVGAHQSGAAADGRRPDHRGVRGGGDRRHGFHHGIDHHRLYARRDRGTDQILLSRSLQHRGIRADGAGAACKAFGTDGTGDLT